LSFVSTDDDTIAVKLLLLHVPNVVIIIVKVVIQCSSHTQSGVEEGSEKRGGTEGEPSGMWGGVGSGRGVPSPADYGIWGSVMSSSSGVQGRAQAGNAFWTNFGS